MNSKAFTLIEILVSLAVISTITGLVLVNYNNFNQVERMRQAGRNLRNDMRSIQAKASSGAKPVGVTCTTLVGYQINFNTNSYNYQPVCTEGLVNPVVTVALPSGVEFYPIPLSQKFDVLAGTTANDAIVTVTTLGKKYHVQVSKSGDISDLGTKQLPDPTPTPYFTPTPYITPTITPLPTSPGQYPTSTPTRTPTPLPSYTPQPTATRTPTPIPTSTPTPTPLNRPGNLHVSPVPQGSVTATIAWTAVPGATRYLLRVHDTTVVPWVCPTSPSGPDRCVDVTTNSYAYYFQKGRTYDIWVHSYVNGVTSDAASLRVVVPE
jgi:prepilin-type N-terminal cleavage/methylation domain-containing protein